MARRKPRRPRGRPLRLLEPGVQDRLVDATRAGTPIALAAEYAGVSSRIFQLWMSRGHDEEEARAEGKPPDPDEEPYYVLWQQIKEARSAAAVHSVTSIRRAAQGGSITKETTRRFRDPVDGQVVTETVVDRAPPDWRAAAWMLERQQAQHFGKAATQMEVSGPGGGPLELTAARAEGLTEQIRANIAAITEAASKDTMNVIDSGPDDDGDVVDAEVVGSDD